MKKFINLELEIWYFFLSWWYDFLGFCWADGFIYYMTSLNKKINNFKVRHLLFCFCWSAIVSIDWFILFLSAMPYRGSLKKRMRTHRFSESATQSCGHFRIQSWSGRIFNDTHCNLGRSWRSRCFSFSGVGPECLSPLHFGRAALVGHGVWQRWPSHATRANQHVHPRGHVFLLLFVIIRTFDEQVRRLNWHWQWFLDSNLSNLIPPTLRFSCAFSARHSFWLSRFILRGSLVLVLHSNLTLTDEIPNFILLRVSFCSLVHWITFYCLNRNSSAGICSGKSTSPECR